MKSAAKTTLITLLSVIVLGGCSSQVKESFNKGFEQGRQTVQGDAQNKIETSDEIEALELDQLNKELDQAYQDLKQRFETSQKAGETAFPLDWSSNYLEQLRDLKEKLNTYEVSSQDPEFQRKLKLKTIVGDLQTLFDEYEKALSGQAHDSNFFENSVQENLN